MGSRQTGTVRTATNITAWVRTTTCRRSRGDALIAACNALITAVIQQLATRLHASKATLARVFAPLTPAELCMLLLGLSWVKVQPPARLLDAIALDAVQRIDTFNAQGAFVYWTGVVFHVSAMISLIISPSGYSNMLWAMFSMRHNALDGRLITAIGDAMRAQADYASYSVQAVANIFQVAAWDQGTPLQAEVLDGLGAQALALQGQFLPRTYASLLVWWHDGGKWWRQ